MSDAMRCPKCGAKRPADAPEGLCPRCLLQFALAEDPPVPADDATAADPDATASGPLVDPTAAHREATHEHAPGPAPSGAAGETGVATLAADGNGEDLSLPRGTKVRYFGDYEIRNELGRGGMGVVYEARQVSLNRMVALKMVKAGLLAGDDELRRFRNEAEVVALLDHPGVVPVYEVGALEGQHYFSMKLVPGGSLVSLLDRYTADPRAAAILVAEAAEAVAHAHMRGLLHRDLKPANLLVDEDGHAHVTDFGLAKRLEADVELTASGALLGTPAYMSPEQATGRRGSITTATDVYGLGAVLYALLTGQAPFGGDSVVETIDAVRHKPPEPPTRLNARVPTDLETICLKCLEKEPRRRYATAQALADDLRAWLGSRPIAARRVGASERAWLWCRRNPWLAGAIGSTAAAVVAVAVISTAFAVKQTRAKNQISGLAHDLRSSLEKSETLSGELKTSLKESHTRLARLDFERAQNAFENEQIGPGLLRLVQSWRSAIAADDPGWQHAARAGLSAWRRQFVEPRKVLHLGGAVGRVAFSPDSKTVLTSSDDHTARLWDAATGRPIGAPMQHRGWIWAVAFSPDGTAVLTGSSDNTARLWDAATGRPLGPPLRHQQFLRAVAFSPDGKTVLTGSHDNTARLWDAATGRPLGPPLRHEGFVDEVAFSPDGKTVLTACRDNTARLWDVTELPDEPERVSAWVSKVTGLGLDDDDEIQLLDSTALRENRERLESLGGSPAVEPRWSLDPILFGSEPAARARAWLERGRGDLALAAFDEALRARPLYAPLWAERARFHAAQGRREQAAEDAAQAALVCWNDPDLAALARGDAGFRDEALSEILQVPTPYVAGGRPGPEVWRGLGRRRASRGDWAGALRDFAAAATPVPLLSGDDLLAQACLLHLAGDDEGARRLAEDVRGLPESAPRLDRDGSPIPDPNVQMRLWVRLLDDPPLDPADLVHRAENYVTKNKGAALYVLGTALLRAGRLDEAVRRFEESLAVQREWANSGMNAYGLALAHHRLGHPEEARRWLERAEAWLDRHDRTYAVAAPGILSGGPQVSVSLEFWVYAQLLRREAAGPILDAAFPADPFVR